MHAKITAFSAAVVLAPCGGGNRAPNVPFSSVVSFGDSLIDVGTYKVGTVAAVGGGKFTVNGANGRQRGEVRRGGQPA